MPVYSIVIQADLIVIQTDLIVMRVYLIVIPAKAGIHKLLHLNFENKLDSGLRPNDKFMRLPCRYPK